MGKMTLLKLEIKALIEVYSGRKSIGEVAKALNIGLSAVSMVISRLEKKQLVNKIRRGKTLELSMSATPHAQAFRRLIVQTRQFKLDWFLFGLRFRVMSSCLYEEKTTEEIAQMLHVPRKSIQNILRPLISRLILKREKRHILFQRKAWPLLFDFLDNYRRFSFVGDVLWKFEDEIVYEVREKEEVQGSLTGFNRYSKYSIYVNTVKYCCYLPRRELSKYDVFMHSLLQIGDETRLLELAIAYYKKNKLNEKILIKIAPKYDLRRLMQDFVYILNCKEEKIRTGTLPPASNKGISDMMRLYNVEN